MVRGFRVALLALFLALTVSSRAGAREVFPIRLARGKLPVVAVRVDGHGPFDFLLDTGATATVFRSDLARSLGVRIERAARVGTPGGDRVFLRAARAVIFLGDRAEAPVAPLVSPLDSFKSVDGRIQGILGLDWLSRFNFLIDYENETLWIDDIHAEGPESPRVSYRLEGRKILVPVRPDRWARDPVWLVLDTGAEGLLLLERSGLAVVRSPRRPVKLSSAAGARIARSGSLAGLVAGSVVLRDVPVTLLADARVLGSAAGLLPGRLFRRLYVNHREGYVVFDPDR